MIKKPDVIQMSKLEEHRTLTSFLMNWSRDIRMRKYHIEISQTARRDITRNTDYIAIDKQSPETARSRWQGDRGNLQSEKTRGILVF